jgi:hypothetical protein
MIRMAMAVALLVLDAAVGCHEDIEAAFQKGQKLAVVFAFSSLALHRGDVMTLEHQPQRQRHVFVETHPHAPPPARAPARPAVSPAWTGCKPASAPSKLLAGRACGSSQ